MAPLTFVCPHWCHSVGGVVACHSTGTFSEGRLTHHPKAAISYDLRSLDVASVFRVSGFAGFTSCMNKVFILQDSRWCWVIDGGLIQNTVLRRCVNHLSRPKFRVRDGLSHCIYGARALTRSSGLEIFVVQQWQTPRVVGGDDSLRGSTKGQEQSLRTKRLYDRQRSKRIMWNFKQYRLSKRSQCI